MKLYVSSAHRAAGSHDADFSISFPRPIVIRGKQKAFVDAVVLSNSFWTIRSFENDQLYVRENASAYRILTIPEGQYNAYTLRDAVKAILTANKTIAGDYNVIYNDLTNRLELSMTGTGSFHIFSGQLLADLSVWNTPAFASGGPLISVLRDSSRVTGLVGDALLSGTSSIPIIGIDSINVMPYSQLFLRSSMADTTQVFGPNGGSDIIRRIVSGQTPVNQLIFDTHSLPYDATDIQNREFNSLSFQLTDSSGRIVNTRGHELSFSICFVPVDE